MVVDGKGFSDADIAGLHEAAFSAPGPKTIYILVPDGLSEEEARAEGLRRLAKMARIKDPLCQHIARLPRDGSEEM